MTSATSLQYWGSIYAQCCDVLLEPGGLQLGLLTDDQFYALALEVLLDFFGKTNLVKKIFNMRIMAGIATYPEPDQLSEVDTALVDQTYLHRTSGYYLDNSDPSWGIQNSAPAMFREDELPVGQIELSPTPVLQGNDIPSTNEGWGVIAAISSANDFTITASTAGFGVINGFTGNPYLESANLGFGMIGDATVSAGNLSAIGPMVPDGLEGILMLPPSFRLYLKYGILAKVFGSDSELKDMQKAAYCSARYAEGVNLAAAIMASDYTEAVK
jgi:hypothetical protein